MGKASDEQQSGTETIGFKNPITQLGWAKIDHILTFDPTLSDGAYRTYAMLVYHAQQNGETYVSLDTIGNERDLRRETISAHVKELEEHGLITRIARDGTSSITQIEDLPKVYQDMAAVVLNARGSLLGKSNTPCAKNLTQERKQESNNNNNTLQDSWHKELEQLTGGYMGGGEEFKTLTDAWQRFPDVRRHTEAIRQTTAAHSRTVRVYLKAFLTFNPDYVPPAPKPQTTYQRPKPGIGRAGAPRAAQAGGLDYSKPITEADRKRQFDEIMAARRANGMSVPGGSP
jgi:biotin operon repressor